MFSSHSVTSQSKRAAWEEACRISAQERLMHVSGSVSWKLEQLHVGMSNLTEHETLLTLTLPFATAAKSDRFAAHCCSLSCSETSTDRYG